MKTKKLKQARQDGKKTKIDAKNAELKSKTSAIDVPATENEIQKGICTAVRDSEESIHAFIERTCVWCARCRSVPTADRAILEFLIRSPGIWLVIVIVIVISLLLLALTCNLS